MELIVPFYYSLQITHPLIEMACRKTGSIRLAQELASVDPFRITGGFGNSSRLGAFGAFCFFGSFWFFQSPDAQITLAS
ncbi:MAG: hypothetical protein ACI87E_001371 [Mariniblastus sp.]|jgi:hypothetical protein